MRRDRPGGFKPSGPKWSAASAPGRSPKRRALGAVARLPNSSDQTTKRSGSRCLSLKDLFYLLIIISCYGIALRAIVYVAIGKLTCSRCQMTLRFQGEMQ